jgi:hypothetical protein
VLCLGLAGPVDAQETTSTSTPSLLVEGTTSTLPPPTVVAPPAGPGTAGEGSVAPDADAADEPSGLDSPSTRLWLAAGVLVAVAVVVLILTAVYWRSTRPGRRAESTSVRRTVDLDALLDPEQGDG